MEDNEVTSKQKHAHTPIHGENGLVYEVADKAEGFADSMERQCSLDYKDADLDHVEEIEADVRRILRAPDQ